MNKNPESPNSIVILFVAATISQHLPSVLRDIIEKKQNLTQLFANCLGFFVFFLDCTKQQIESVKDTSDGHEFP